ncbi:MAG TPA: sodium-dependent transporter [Candidatus Krumholzibacteria bacterium]|nr:sodium-dependent transporter [Candidatus Krumholzibacteria bacterium]
MEQARGQWGSSTGFILAAAGSAIGLGNIWRFPYVAGEYGGAAFVLLYLACVVLICLPYLFAELVLGRYSHKNPVGAIEAIRGRRSLWAWAGALGVLTGVGILSYYAVIAGWTLGYIFKSFVAPHMEFGAFTGDALVTIPLFALFMILTIGVVLGGVESGIERTAKVLMPVLLVLMLLVILRGLTLPGAMAGLSFYLKPDFSQVTTSTVLTALGQAFFSLSLGMGAMITYGSYLPKGADLRTAGAFVAFFDTLIAVLAGFMIFPAVFAMGESPDAGPSLVFVVLPKVFASMPMGSMVSVVFFVLLGIAALTSTVSLLEVVVAYFVDERHWSRKKSAWSVGFVTFLLGLPAALSQGAVGSLTHMQLFGKESVLGIMDFIWGNISLALGGLLLSVFVGWIWGVKRAGEELKLGSGITDRGIAFWGVFIRYICPVVIFVVLLDVFGVFR